MAPSKWILNVHIQVNKPYKKLLVTTKKYCCERETKRNKKPRDSTRICHIFENVFFVDLYVSYNNRLQILSFKRFCHSKLFTGKSLWLKSPH